MSVPFFSFGEFTAPPAGSPPGLISGGLIMDSGEAERTFIYRCQDRYLVYNGLSGLRSLIFVAGETHRNIYRSLLADLADKFQILREFTGLPFGALPEPFFIPCNIDELRIEAQPWFVRELQQPVIRNWFGRGGLLLNQVSPSTTELITQLAEVLKQNGVAWPLALDRLRAMGKLALEFHNKLRYVELVQANPAGLPPHVPTAILTPGELLAVEDWEDLVRLYTGRTGDHKPAGLYVKSAQDSGGNVAARLTAGNFSAQAAALKREVEQSILWQNVNEAESLRELRQEVELAPGLRPLSFSDAQLSEYRRLQEAQRGGIEILVQREVVATTGSHIYDSFGLTGEVGGTEKRPPIHLAAQLYADADRRHFIGSYLSEALSAEYLTPGLREQTHALFALFAAQGYQGPINFDLRLGAAGEAVFIYDCNPRLSAVYPPLAIREFLRGQGLRAESILSLGYRGEFIYTDVRRPLAQFAAAGLLYATARQRGVLLLPNLCRENGFDVLLVNLSRREMEELIGSGVLQATAEPRSPGRPSLF